MAKLPVLMYHNISLETSFGLTISAKKLEQQFAYLKENNYTSLFASEINSDEFCSNKNVVITFDDVTVNQLHYAVPLLKKYQLKATFFIPFAYIGKSDLWNNGTEPIMTIEQLKSLDNKYVELAHHSFAHHKYSQLSLQEIQQDFDNSFKCIDENKLQVSNTLAYPYGNYPKKNPQKELFFNLLKQNNIKLAFRIGNRINHFPLKNRYEVQRIDIKGEDSLLTFKLKLRFGKLKLF